jgi:hypothetical protein
MFTDCCVVMQSLVRRLQQPNALSCSPNGSMRMTKLQQVPVTSGTNTPSGVTFGWTGRQHLPEAPSWHGNSEVAVRGPQSYRKIFTSTPNETGPAGRILLTAAHFAFRDDFWKWYLFFKERIVTVWKVEHRLLPLSVYFRTALRWRASWPDGVRHAVRRTGDSRPPLLPGTHAILKTNAAYFNILNLF